MSRNTAELVWFVDDLQACEPESLTKDDDIEVVHLYTDTMGFDRVMVSGKSPEAVIEYVEQNWGSQDADWFKEYVVERVECGEV